MTREARKKEDGTEARASTPGWTVDGALAEVVEAIIKGSPLEVTTPVQHRLQELYREDFEDQYSKKQDWLADRPRVLLLARVVGMLASGRTVYKAIGQQKPIPLEVDGDEAAAAAYLVAQAKYCPTPEFLGAWCDKVPDPPTFARRTPAERSALVASLRDQLAEFGIR